MDCVFLVNRGTLQDNPEDHRGTGIGEPIGILLYRMSILYGDLRGKLTMPQY